MCFSSAEVAQIDADYYYLANHEEHKNTQRIAKKLDALKSHWQQIWLKKIRKLLFSNQHLACQLRLLPKREATRRGNDRGSLKAFHHPPPKPGSA